MRSHSIAPDDLVIYDSQKLGRGGFGAVCAGTFGGSPVAIKKLLNPNARSAIKKEAALLLSLRHPNIVQIWGLCERDNAIMMVMPRMPSSVYTCIYADPAPSLGTRLGWLEQTAQAFKYLHSRNPAIIHKDLKPDNILLDENNVARVCDFGLSRFQKGVRLTDYAGLQRHGQYAYAPPESFSPDYHSHTSYDVYSFALTMFHTLSGVAPFQDDFAATLEKVKGWVVDLKYRPERPESGIPDYCWDLIVDCWNQEPHLRPTFLGILERFKAFPAAEVSVSVAEAAKESPAFFWELAESVTPVQQKPADKALSEGPFYEFDGLLIESDDEDDERPVGSTSLAYADVRQAVKESFEPKLDTFNDFALTKIRYIVKASNVQKEVNLNQKLLKLCLGSNRFDNVVVLINKNPAGTSPLVDNKKQKLVVSESDSAKVVVTLSSPPVDFSDVSRQSDITLVNATLYDGTGKEFVGTDLVEKMNSGVEDRVVEIRAVTDTVLSDSTALEPLGLDSSFFTGDLDVVISFIRLKSTDLARRVSDGLRSKGLEVWADDWTNNRLADRMIEAVGKAKVFCLILNREYQNSDYCKSVFNFALTKNKPIVVIRDGNVDSISIAAWEIFVDFTPDNFSESMEFLHKNIQRAIQATAVAISNDLESIESASDDVLYDWLRPVDFSADHQKFEEAYVPPTRQWMLKNLRTWMTREQSILCLLGGAGVGKSVFAWLAHQNPLNYVAPAIFFCRHNNERKNSAKNIISTLAYQLAMHSSEFRRYLLGVLEKEVTEQADNPDMIPLIQRAAAFKLLILDGLSLIKIPSGQTLLIVIDALDECGRPGDIGRANLLLTIKDHYQSLSKGIKLLVTSRPEEDIVLALESIQPDEMIVREQQAIEDVFMYLQVKLTKLCAEAKVFYGDSINNAACRLAEASQGVFVFAALAIKQLTELDKEPATFQLDLLTNVDNWCSGGSMDSIYSPFLQSHYAESLNQDVSMFRAFMGVVLALAVGLTAESIASLLSVPVFQVDSVVLKLRSILHLEDGRITVLHKSVKDFLTSTRCKDPRFRIALASHHDLLCKQSFQLVLLAVSQKVSRELVAYSNTYWTQHLASGTLNPDHLFLMDKLIDDESRRLVAWMQVLLQSSTSPTVAKNQIIVYLSKLKNESAYRGSAERLERIFNIAFVTFGDIYKASLWNNQLDQFRSAIAGTKETSTAVVTQGQYPADVLEFDFYISFEELTPHQSFKSKPPFLKSTVFIVLLTQRYEDSRHCKAIFDYAKANDRGMVGIYLDPKQSVRGDASTLISNNFWTASVESYSEFKNWPMLFKVKGGLKFQTWTRFARAITTANLTVLTRLNLSSNYLTGSIPPEIAKLTQLIYLHLDFNKLAGSIPPEIGKLTQLTNFQTLLIVIDALDECGRPGDIGRANLLLTIKDHYQSLSKGIKLLVTSRPEEDIVLALESIQPDEMIVREQQAIEDVFMYLQVKLTKLCAEAKVFYGDSINNAACRLAEASQGVFVFAALAIKQLTELDKEPATFQLDLLTNVDNWCSGGSMDSIYSPFLQSHYAESLNQDVSMFRAFMGVVLALAVGLTAESIASLLSVPVFQVDSVVLKLRSILHLEDGRITVLHKSVKDFLTSTRCKDPRFRIALATHHDLLCKQSFQLVLLAVTQKVSRELVAYSNTYWTQHLASGTLNPDHLFLMDKLIDDESRRLVAWMQVLLQSSTSPTVAKNQIIVYLSKLKNESAYRGSAERLERIFNIAFVTFGDIYKASLWNNQLDQFRSAIAGTKETSTAVVTQGQYPADVLEFDFYISFEEASTAVAKTLAQGLQFKNNQTAYLMNQRTDTASIIQEQAAILKSTVFIVLLTQRYEDSRHCKAIFDYAKANDRGMVGIYLDPKQSVRGDASTLISNNFWTASVESYTEFKNWPTLFKVKGGLKFQTWTRFARAITTANLTVLTRLNLSSNYLTGSIPPEIAKLTQLIY
ncbi:UNVERIFIED_CONTAM: hypothetical protein HDU68_010662, partial [Siphonaria sp. JEL0065]